jgi:hypothetical protein
LADDVVRAHEEANQNLRYLKSMEEYFVRLRDEVDITRLEPLFYPLLHTLLLVWQHSTTYNTEHRLQVLVKELCNALVNVVRGATASCIASLLLLRPIGLFVFVCVACLRCVVPFFY